MEGQPGQHSPRTAGERAGNPNDPSGVRDWQKDTWFGPAPVHSNPFEEPEDAPELKEFRTENVTEHVGDFWMPYGKGYQATSAVPSASGSEERKAKKRKGFPLSNRLLAAVFVLLLASALVLRYVVFTVREIQVTGNASISSEEIIRVSGIRLGDSTLSLNEKDVGQRISSDYRLLFRYMARQMPSRVILSIREREPCCWLTYCGILYVMDKNRMVLYESETPGEKPANLVEIKGLEVRSDTRVGLYVNLGNEAQQAVFSELFLEMKVLSCTDQIAEADISNPGSILLSTRDGYTVAMGNAERLHAKFRSLLLVRDELNRMGYTGGTINVSNPESPIFTP